MTQEQAAFFDKLYIKHINRMKSAARVIVHGEAAAEDMVSDAFLSLITHINEVMEHENPEAWLYRVLRRNAIDEWRRVKRHGDIPLEMAIVEWTEQEMLAFADMLPAGLTEEERKLLLWRFSEDLDYTEMANRLHITEANCRMKMTRAKRRCAELLRKEEERAAKGNE